MQCAEGYTIWTANLSASLSIPQMESHHNGARSCYRPAHARNMNLNNSLPLERKGKARVSNGNFDIMNLNRTPFPQLHGYTLGLSRTFTPTLKQRWIPPWCASWLSYKRFHMVGTLTAQTKENFGGFEWIWIRICSKMLLSFHSFFPWDLALSRNGKCWKC